MKITVDVQKDRDQVWLTADDGKAMNPLPVLLTVKQAKSLAIVLVRKLGLKPEDLWS